MKDCCHHICDFCGEANEMVRRVVVDKNYDRVLALAKYACPSCSEQKDKEREENGDYN